MRSALLVVASLLSASTFGQLVINEVDYDQPSTDNAEYLELKNTGSSPVDMANIAVVLVNGNGGNAVVYDIVSSPSWPSLEAGAYFTLCGDHSAGCNDTLPHATNAIQNGPSDAIALIQLPDSTIIDLLSYEGSVPGYTEGTGAMHGDDNTTIDRSIGRWPDGSDTDNNSIDFLRMCSTPGAINMNDTTSCSITTGIAERSNAPALTVFADPGNDRVWIYMDVQQASPVTFDVFAVDGSLLATRTVNMMAKASWGWSTGGVHGRVYLIRATSTYGTATRRIVMP